MSTIHLPTCSLYKDTNGIIHIEIKPGKDTTAQHFEPFKEALLTICGNKQSVLLIDLSGYSLATTSFEFIRLFIDDKEIRNHTKYILIVSSNFIQKTVIELITKLFKPNLPFKAFDSQEKAVAWYLKNF
ncbi:MAG: hypothetical protein D6707_03135 [Bacteroidetes bacterium]|nr:MAG: hypothetical protein D6707_03135 [Bacteroidota bacterium]